MYCWGGGSGDTLHSPALEPVALTDRPKGGLLPCYPSGYEIAVCFSLRSELNTLLAVFHLVLGTVPGFAFVNVTLRVSPESQSPPHSLTVKHRLYLELSVLLPPSAEC